MRILTETEIATAVTGLAPKSIAVAYLGADWQRYVSSTTKLREVIISPTLGTNPNAVSALVKLISWERVFFLRELHAKIYFGEKLAIVGSANLTANGLDGQRLLECCIEIDDEGSLSKLSAIVTTIKSRAVLQFPTTESKKNALSKLYDVWNNSIANGVLHPKSMPRTTLGEFELLSNSHFYVSSWVRGTYEYSDELRQTEGDIQGEMHFAPEDPPQANKFVLTWLMKQDGSPDLRSPPEWMYIHQVVPNGVAGEDYPFTTCAVERKSLVVPPKPFEITEEIVKRFRQAIASKFLSKYFIQRDNDFRLSASFSGLPLLVEAMREDR